MTIIDIFCKFHLQNNDVIYTYCINLVEAIIRHQKLLLTCRELPAATLSYHPSQHFNVGSMLFQRCGSTLKWRWSDVENETKSDIGFSTLHNVDTTSVPDVQTTSKQRCTTLVQPSVESNRASDDYGFVNRWKKGK